MNLKSLIKNIISDPLVHFAGIGVVIFGMTQVLSGAEDDPKAVQVGAPVYRDLVNIFAEKHERAPTVPEMSELLDRWVMNEVLYREARALGLDQGDEMIRERIMQKMRILVQSAVLVPPPEDAALRAWFDENRDRYETPARISFRLARLDAEASSAERAVLRMNMEDASEAAVSRQVYTFENRPRPGLVSAFDEDMVAAIEAAPIGAWSAIDTVNGWQAVQVLKIDPAEPVDFETLRARVLVDYENQAFRTAATEAVEALIDKYDVDVSPYEPAAFEETALAAARKAAGN